MNHQPTVRRCIRVLLVDDSPLALDVTGRMLRTDDEIEVCGTARDGREALALLPRLLPDVVCTDLYMPGMGGLEFTREVMATHPVPILVLSVAVQHEQAGTIFEMLEAGAVDIVAKPRVGLLRSSADLSSELIRKIKIASGVVALRRRQSVPAHSVPEMRAPEAPRMVGIAASTGGPQALERVLRDLRGDFPLPVLCVQHISQGFTEGLVDWLDRSCPIAVRTAHDGLLPQPGSAYFAPEGRHLLVAEGRLRCPETMTRAAFRPSANVGLSSLAREYGAGSIGVILTGMGDDGAAGIVDIASAGGITIAQDEGSCVVFGMPAAAIATRAVRHVLPLGQIGPALSELTNGVQHAQTGRR